MAALCCRREQEGRTTGSKQNQVSIFPAAVAITLEQLNLVTADHTKYDLSMFDCGHQDLNDFIKHDCPVHAGQKISITKLAQYADEVVGYITLLADSITLHQDEVGDFPFKQIPALKIGRLGIATKYQGQGIGTALMKYAVGVAFRMNDELGVGCRFLTVDSDPKAVGFYRNLGFVDSIHRAYKDRHYPNMHYDIVSGPSIG
jgi:GNAT superfamily N-acetyltransferase